MKILFISKDYPPNLIGGVGVYTLEMSRLFAKMGHEVYVISKAVEYPCKYIDRGVIVFRVKPCSLKFFNFLRQKFPGTIERLEYAWVVCKKIKEIVQKYNIDIIESSEARFEGFWYYLFNKKPKLVIKLHTPESVALKLDNVYPGFDYKVSSILEEWWIARADKVISLTQAVKELTSSHFNIKLSDSPIVSNPIDINFFKPKASDANSNNDFIVLYAGRLEFRKGVHVLMRAIPIVLSKFRETKFIFIGKDSGMNSYLLRKIKQLGCSDNVSMIEGVSRNRLREFYQNSSICVLPSLWENHPYVCLEAMACGKPVIATNIGGFPEIIQNGFNGILIDPGSPNGLGQAITELIMDNSLCDKLGKNARTTIEERYSPKEVATKTLSIYKQLLAR